jgi:imidazoleglycerol phosphate synthase glutamine amidotransferase subunit HisH
MQLLFKGSEESPGYEGLGILDGILEQTNPGPAYPNFGWEVVGPPEKSIFMYFAHSYCARQVPEQWNPLWTQDSTRFVAQISNGNILGCQFHPEISGYAGEQLLKTWIRNTEYEQ